MVLWGRILKKFSAFNLVAEFSKSLKTLSDNQKCKLVVAAKSAKWGYKNLAVFLWMKNLVNLADLAVLAD